jgi:hypothetical protein
MDNPGFESRLRQHLFLLSKSPVLALGHILPPVGIGDSFLEVNLPGCYAYHLPPSNTEGMSLFPYMPSCRGKGEFYILMLGALFIITDVLKRLGILKLKKTHIFL